jgi:hypothetical protein
MTDEDRLIELGELVTDQAQTLFEHCGARDDFCIQHVGLNSAVFGGTNRVLWNAINGFWLDESYCTERFIKAFNLYMEDIK